MKVFENLPNNVNHALVQNSNTGNDCYVKWYVMEEYPEREYYDSDSDYEDSIREYKDSDAWIVNEWLIGQGCIFNEKVILEHYW